MKTIFKILRLAKMKNRLEEQIDKEVFGPRLISFPETEYKIKIVKKRFYHKYFKRESRHTFGQLVLNICSDKKGNVFIECDEFKISSGEYFI